MAILRWGRLRAEPSVTLGILVVFLGLPWMTHMAHTHQCACTAAHSASKGASPAGAAGCSQHDLGCSHSFFPAAPAASLLAVKTIILYFAFLLFVCLFNQLLILHFCFPCLCEVSFHCDLAARQCMLSPSVINSFNRERKKMGFVDSGLPHSV